MTLLEILGIIAALLTAIGTPALIIFFFTRKLTGGSLIANTAKTNKEIEQIEQEIESKYAVQVKLWLEDLEDINSKHKIVLAEKDSAITDLHHKYLIAIKDISEKQLRLDRFNKATRRILVNMDVPYWECDSHGTLTYVNGAWLKLFGIKQVDALAGKWINCVPALERDQLLLEWNSRVVDQSEGDIEFNIINPLTTETSRIKALYAIIFDSEDNIFKIIGVTVVLPKYITHN